MKEHEAGGCLQKDGDVYKTEPFHANYKEIFDYGFLSIVLQIATNKMFCIPFLIAKDVLSFTHATKQQKENFDKTAQLYQ